MTQEQEDLVELQRPLTEAEKAELVGCQVAPLNKSGKMLLRRAGGWKSYVELEAENVKLRKALETIKPMVDHMDLFMGFFSAKDSTGTQGPVPAEVGSEWRRAKEVVDWSLGVKK